MSDQPQRPKPSEDREAWKTYWAESQSREWFEAWGYWRTEPEIDEKRQSYLAERRNVQANIDKGIYPIRDENGSILLTRADVEWMLATHESGGMVGPVHPTQSGRPQRTGIGLQGANLKGQDLSDLPLTRLDGGFDIVETPQSLRHLPFRSLAAEGAVNLEGANLHKAHLEWAFLDFAHLEKALLSGAYLDDAFLMGAHLEGALMSETSCIRAKMSKARLEHLHALHPHFDQARLGDAHLEDAMLFGAYFDGADLTGAHLEGATLSNAHLNGATLNRAFLDRATILDRIELGDEANGFAFLADVSWGDANLTVVTWTREMSGIRGKFSGRFKRSVAVELGDEREPHKGTFWNGKSKPDAQRLQEYQDAVRANRQLATALRSQGLNEDADRFSYKAQKLQREVLQRQRHPRHPIAVAWSWILYLIAGYGYRPLRSVITYVSVVLIFASFYFIMRDSVHPALNPGDSLIFSITSFHGRGFMPGENVSLHNPLTIAAAAEAIVGLFIEITFIATFTQRFFAR